MSIFVERFLRFAYHRDKRIKHFDIFLGILSVCPVFWFSSLPLTRFLPALSLSKPLKPNWKDCRKDSARTPGKAGIIAM